MRFGSYQNARPLWRVMKAVIIIFSSSLIEFRNEFGEEGDNC
jgi:hypothetical protein